MIIKAYSKLALERACDAVEDGWLDEFAESEFGHVFLAPKPAMFRAEELEKGIYRFAGVLEARVASYDLFFEFKSKLADLLILPYPPSVADEERWRERLFAELLDIHEPREGQSLFLGTEQCQEMSKNLDDYADTAYWSLPTPYYDVFLTFQRTARLASKNGVLIIA
jgi:hypothetical protein